MIPKKRYDSRSIIKKRTWYTEPPGLKKRDRNEGERLTLGYSSASDLRIPRMKLLRYPRIRSVSRQKARVEIRQRRCPPNDCLFEKTTKVKMGKRKRARLVIRIIISSMK